MTFSRLLPKILPVALLLALLLSACPNPAAKTKVEPAPDIYLRQDGTTVGMGQTVPFAATLVGASRDLTFTIENTGSEELLLTGGPVALSGSGVFTVQANAAATIGAGANTTFTLRFSPIDTAAQQTTVSIESNDPDEDPFTFAVSGTGSVVSGSILIQGGDLYTNSTSVTLTLSPDDPGSVAQMLLSNSADFSGASWEGFQDSRAWTLTAGDGTKTVYVKFRDGSGGESLASVDEIILDATPPEAPEAPDLAAADDSGVSDTDNLTNRTTGLTFTGTGGEVGSTIQLYANSVTMSGATATVAGDGTWSSADASLTAGTWSITARATDPAGNSSDPSGELSVEIDTTPPAGAPSILKPMQGANTGNQRRPTFTWTAPAGADRYDFQVDTDSAFALPRAISLSYHDATSYAPTSELAVSTSAPVGRRYYLRVRALDAAGNATAWSHAGMHRYVNVGRFDHDVNGDGYSDVIVGIPTRAAPGWNSGTALLYFGGPSMDGVPDLFPVTEGYGDQFGYSVAFAGDVNADGYGDFLIGAPYASENFAEQGQVYLYFGGSTADAWVDKVFTGAAAGDHSGYSVACAGDVNGDRYGDVIVGAPGNDAGGGEAGAAYVYLGGAFTDETPDLTVTGEAANDAFGASVACAGDANSDGYDDLIVGAPLNDAGATDAGRAYVYLGAGTLEGTADLTLTVFGVDDQFGFSVSGARDMNGDGYGDFLVGAPKSDVNAINSVGRAYLYLGAASLDGMADVTIAGEAPYDCLGTSVASVGDANADGYADLIVSAPGNDNGAADGGGIYLHLGAASPDGAADLIGTGATAGDGFGFSVSGAGDANGDGYADFIVGAPKYDDGADADSGRAYLYFGGSSPNSTADVIMTGSDAGDHLGWSVD